MNHVHGVGPCVLVLLVACGGETFAPGDGLGGGGGSGGGGGGGSGGAGDSSACSSPSAASAASAAGGEAATSTTSSVASSGGAGAGTGSGGDGGAGGAPCQPATCETADVACGIVPDGCGGELDCGDYLVHDNCSFGAPVYTCECDAAHPVAWQCASGDKKEKSPAPTPGCVPNVGMPDYFWCCEPAS